MAYLRNRATYAVTEDLDPEGVIYQALKNIKFQSDTTAYVPTGTSGIPSGSVGEDIPAGTPMFEAVPAEDVPADPQGGRIIATMLEGSLTATSDYTQQIVATEGFTGEITEVMYVPKASFPGHATNNRVYTLNQVTLTGTGTVTRTVTALATRTTDATHALTKDVPAALTVSEATIASVPPATLEVAVTHGGTPTVVEPGGVLYFTYTRTA